MSGEDFLKLVSSLLVDLFEEYRFIQIRSKVDKSGQGLVIYESEKYKLKFLNERKRVIVSIGLNENNSSWCNLNNAISFLEKENYSPDFSLDIENQTQKQCNLLKIYAAHVFTNDVLIDKIDEIKRFGIEDGRKSSIERINQLKDI